LVAAEDALAVGGMASSAGSPPRRDARPARRTDRHAEAAAEGNRHGAERAYSRRNLFVGLAATAAVGITAGLILRGTAVLGDARQTVVALLVFIAVLTGMLMPMVSYLSIARDGSKVSRERDSVAADLDNDRDTFLEAMEGCRRAVASVAEIRDTLKTKDLPDVCNIVQEPSTAPTRPTPRRACSSAASPQSPGPGPH
jgi:ABC-type multidrug transport system fused ATPase/permease subunit